jgi:hypothetical protein
MRLLAAAIVHRGGPGYLCLDDVVVEKRSPNGCGGRVDLLVCQEAQGLRHARGGAAVVQHRPALEDPGGVSAVAAQTLLRPAPLPDQAAAGRADADRGPCCRPAGCLPGDGYPLHRRLADPPGRTPWRHLVGTLPPRTTVVWHGRRRQVAELAGRLRLWWRPRRGLRAAAVSVYAPTYGTLRLVVTRNRHGNLECLATGELDAELSGVVARKHSRWRVETIFRDTKQDARAGGLPVLVGCCHGPPCRPGPGGLGGAATAAPAPG